MADSGIDRALFELQLNMDFGADGIGNASGTLGAGTFVTTITPAFAGNGQYTLRSTATVGVMQRTVEAVVDRKPAAMKFFGREAVRMSSGWLDSYDSSVGTYASQLLGDYAGNADVGSNGDITLFGSAQVYGNATPGPTGSVSNPSKVTGSTAPAVAPVVLDPYFYAPPLPSMGAWTGAGTFGTGVYRYTTLDVSKGAVLTLSGDVVLYIDDKFTLSEGAAIVLSPGSTATIHHGANRFEVAGKGIINEDNIPNSLHIFSATTKKLELVGSSNFFGTVYAPDAGVLLAGGSGLFGSLQSRVIRTSGGSALHFDRALSGSSSNVYEIIVIRPVAP